MKGKKIALVGSLLLAVVLTVGVAVFPSAAQTPPPPIAVELLTDRGVFTDDVSMTLRLQYTQRPGETRPAKDLKIGMEDASRTVVAKITVQPGARYPWHTHPGPVLVNVAQGELVYIAAKDCVERHYDTGEVLVDPGRGNVHTAYNPTDGETVLYATFLEVPATGPLTITAGVTPGNCDVEVGTHHH